MVTHDFPPILDVRRVAEASVTLQGQTHLSRFSRLWTQFGAKVEGKSLSWTATFGMRKSSTLQEQAGLELSIHLGLPLVCQRCLGEFEHVIDVSQAFRFVADEATAQVEDDASEEDLLVLSRAFDLAELIEDEVIMSLPVLPRHAQCPRPLVSTTKDADFDQAPTKESPFAALEQLKSRKPH